MSEHLNINDVSDAHQQEYQHLAADSLKADLAGQPLVGNGAHDAGKVVTGHKDHQRYQEPVAATKELPKPSSDSGKYKLNRVPEFFHEKIPPLCKIKAACILQTAL